MHRDEIASRLRGAAVPDSSAAEERTVEFARGRAAASVEDQPGTGRRRQRLLRVAAFSGVGAFVLTALIALVAIGGEGRGEGGSFGSFAALAAEQEDGGFQHIESDSRLFYELPDGPTTDDRLELELWVGADQRYERSTHRFLDGKGTKVGKDEYLFDRELDRTCFRDRLQPKGLTRRGCFPLSANGPIEQALWRAYELPETVSGLEDEVDRFVRGFPSRDRDDDGKPDGCGDAGPRFGVPIPTSLTVGVGRQELVLDLRAVDGANTDGGGFRYRRPDSELRYLFLAGILTSPHASPDLRAAAFEVLGGVEGAQVEGEGEDRLGRAAAVISYAPPPPPSGDPTTLDQIYLDPTTSLVLELRTTVSSGEQELGSFDQMFPTWERVESLPDSAAPLQANLRKSAERCERG